MLEWTFKHRVLAVAMAVVGTVFLGSSPALAEEAARDSAAETGKTEHNTAQDSAMEAGKTERNSAQENAQQEKKLKVTNDYNFTYNDVSGPGETSSSLARGGHFTDVLNVDWNNKKNDKGLSLNFTLNITDDRTVDAKRLSLTNFLLNYESPTHNASLGDVMGSFSPYSMSGSVKGLSYKYQDAAKTGPEISLIYGSQYARWDNFWDNDPDTQSLNRMVGAARVKQELSDDFTLGMNFVKTHDHRTLINENSTRYNTNVLSMDWEYKPTPFWTYSGELARSISAEAYADQGYIGKTGRALRLTSVMEKGKTRFDMEYEQVTPDFLTQTGSASVDKEKIKVGWKDRLGLGSTYHATVYWDRNNLEDQLTTSTQNLNYAAGVTLQQPFGRENSTFDISLVRNREHDTDTTNRIEKTLNFNYKDNFKGIDTDATVGYTRNETAGSANQYSWSHNLMLSTNLVRGKTTIVPTLTIAHTKQVLSDFTSQVMTKEYSLGVTANYENGETLSLVGGWKSADYYTFSDSSSNWFANLNWTFKPGFLKKLGATSMYIKVGINDYHYTTSSRNYRENTVVTGVRSEF